MDPLTAAAYFAPAFQKLGVKATIEAVKLAHKSWTEEEKLLFAQYQREVLQDKTILRKIAEKITIAIPRAKIPPAAMEILRRLDADEVLRFRLASAFLEGDDDFIRTLTEADSTFHEYTASPDEAGARFIDAVLETLSEDESLSKTVLLRASRVTTKELRTINDNLQFAEIRSAEANQNLDRAMQTGDVRGIENSETLATILRVVTASAEESGIKDILKSQHRAAFDAALTELKKGSIEKATEDFEAVIRNIELAGTHADNDLRIRSYLNLSSCWVEQEQWEKAKAILDKVEAMSSSDLRLKRHLAVYLSRTGKNEEALKIIQALRVIEPDNREHAQNESALHILLGQHSEAYSLLQKANTDDGPHWIHISEVQQKLGFEIEAIQSARTACERVPDDENCRLILAYALGLPIMHRRSAHKELLTVSDAEMPRMSEAISIIENVIPCLRERKRLPLLRDALATLAGFQCAVGNHQKSVELGVELQKLGHLDPGVLQNLFYAQMVAEDFDAAVATASAFPDQAKGQWHKANALMENSKFDEVISIATATQEGGQFFPSKAHWISLEAYSNHKLHRSEAALIALDAGLVEYPENPEILLEKAGILRDLDRLKEAEEFFQKAALAAGPASQAALDYGLFLYRGNQWKDALARFETFGAKNVTNPLFPKYLVCLFNVGNYAACLDAFERHEKAGRGFDETIYAVAARCFDLIGDLREGQRVVSTLIDRERRFDVFHRRLLAAIYFRLDELEEATTLLKKVVNKAPDDVEAKLHLSAVLTARGLHLEAAETARSAVNQEQLNLRARSVFFHAMLAVTEAAAPTTDLIEEHHRNTEALTATPNDYLQAIPMDSELAEFREMLVEREQFIKSLDQTRRERNIPLGVFARQAGTRLFDAWRNAIFNESMGIQMSFGSHESQNAERTAAMEATSVALDTFALFTLHGLRVLELLQRCYSRIYVHTSILDEIVAHRRHLESHAPSGTIASVNGQLFHSDIERGAIEQTKDLLFEIQSFLKGPSVSLVGFIPFDDNEQRREKFDSVCGMATVSAIYVARERGAALYADDLTIREIANSEFSVTGFGTQGFLRSAVGRGLLSGVQYDDAVLRLFEWHYHFVSEGAETLIRGYEKANGQITPLMERLIRRTEKGQCQVETSAGILARFLAFVWRSGSLRKDQREKWAELVWTSLLGAHPPDEVLVHFVSELGMQLAALPECFMGVMAAGVKSAPTFEVADALVHFACGLGQAASVRLPRTGNFFIAGSPSWLRQVRAFKRHIRWARSAKEGAVR